MDARDFNRWYIHFGACFPDTANWLESLPNANEVKGVWRDALSDVKAEDAKEVTLRMVRGDIEQIQNYDREKTPSIIRKHAAAIVKERAQSIPVRQPSFHDAYHCRWCRDTGFAYVWSIAAMRLAIDGGDVTTLNDRQALVMARCSCVMGYPRGVLPNDAKPNDKHVERTPRVGECKHLLPIIGLNHFSEENLKRLHNKATQYRESAELRDARPEFDEWNQQGAAL